MDPVSNNEGVTMKLFPYIAMATVIGCFVAILLIVKI